MPKPKVGLYWLASCGGCEESVVDLAENILALTDMVDIVFWPVALDFKVSDVEALADGELAAALINGAVRTDEQESMARLLRRKSKAVIAHGACAHMGGVVGLGNFSTKDQLLSRAYREVPTYGTGQVPQPRSEPEKGKIISLPSLLDQALPLDRVIEVDYYIPGCPPSAEILWNALTAFLSGKLPPKGAVLADRHALCDSCSRRDSKPEKLDLKEMKRIHLMEVDPGKCLLAQGIVCLGSATRGGCGERCLKANMPCTGCFGPTDQVAEQGAKFLTCLAGQAEARDPDAVDRFVESLPDPAGLFYRYSLGASGLKGAPKKENAA